MTIRRLPLPVAFAWAFLAVYAVHFLDFHGSVPDFERTSARGQLLDVTPSFSVPGVYDRLEGYGEEGRRNYAFRNVTVDVALPVSLLPFLWLFMRAATTWTVKRVASLLAISAPLVMLAFGWWGARKRSLDAA